ncbi:type IV secretion protein Rhs [Streptomyces cinnamoneus]|uniref:Type IV secretion protein Rhs n=2 Tax=Streptomyces cinnamoneus TaxID=53446 RepID=A0A2G1XAW5_STRCJ|nr:type IV secretion protein Rhs [Streptomyces cinnamoneus]PPT16777.1 type IV secretion protein Rhs [Streptomyces cinnamoneus]
MADALREFADDIDDDAHAANLHVQRLLSSGEGWAMEALNEHWGKVKDKHLKDLASAARLIAGAMDAAAVAVATMKAAAIVQLGYLAEEAGIALSLIPVTGGLSALLGAGAMRLTQEAVRRLIRDCMKEAVGYIVSALTEPAVAALEGMAADLVVQLGATALGLQNGVDVGQAKQAGKDGFKDGVDSAKGQLHLASAGGGGGGEGSKDNFRIDHGEHKLASSQLNSVSTSVHGRTRSKLSKAKRHHGRTRGRDSIAQAIDPVADKAMTALEKAVKEVGDHLGTRLPTAVRQISKDHKRTDEGIRDGFDKAKKAARGKDDGVKPGGRPSDGKPGSGRTKPDPLDKAKDEPRRNAISLEKTVCKTDPVDVATGEMLLPHTDLVLPGVLPLVLRRTHLSQYRYGRWFGRSWASTLDERLELDPVGGGAVWAREDGSLLVYPRLPRPDGDSVLPVEGARLPLVHGGHDGAETTYHVTDPSTGLTRSFTGSPYNTSSAYWLTLIEDRHGNRVEFGRHSDGAPFDVLHSGGYTVQLSTDDERIAELAVRTPDGPVTVMTYGYDDEGNLAAVTNSSGLPLRFTYDDDARITSWTDRNDSTYRYVYDTAGRVVRTVGPDGYLSSTFTYDTAALTTHYTDSTGATTVIQLNDRLQVVAETDPLGNTVRQTWDRHDQLLSRTDALGHTTSWSLDERGNPQSAHLPDGSVSRLVHNELNQLTELTGPDGSVWRQEFDERGNRVSATLPDGSVTRYSYDPAGRLTAVTDARGVLSRIHCDAAGLPVAVMGPLGTVTRYTRDAFGRPLSVTDPLGNTTEFEWTVEGKLARRVDPDGAEQRWTYDGEGNRLSHVDPLGRESRFEYTHFDLLAARTLPDGTRYEFTHDTELRLASVTGPSGARWTYRHDAAGRVVSETDFDGRTLTYTHDAAGRLATRTNGAGETVRYERDVFGRVTAKDAAGAVTRFEHDGMGRLVRAQGPDAELSWRLDGAGRVLAEVCNGRVLSHEYDDHGRRLQRTTPAGAVSTWHYPSDGRRAELHIAGRRLTFEYDEAGREIVRRVGDGLQIQQQWDTLGRLVNQTVTGAEDLAVQHRAYTYGADGILTSVEDRLAGSRSFDLDLTGRVTTVRSGDWTERYAYDETGNQSEATWPAGHPGQDATGPRTYQGDRITRAGSIRYEHDAQGRIVLRQKKRLSRRAETWRYTWDAQDRLTSVVTPDGVVWHYRYDPLGRRIAKQRLAEDGRVVEQVDFTWDGDILCEQTTHGSDGQVASTLTWDYDGLTPVSQTERRSAADAPQHEVDQRFFAIVTDLVGTPRELVDENGEVAWHTRSTLWGLTTWNRTATAYTPLRFPGQYFDPESGLHYNRFRYYDPQTARYLSPDPLGLVPAANPLAYVHNPTMWIDPLGLAGCPHRKTGEPHDVVLGVNPPSDNLARHLRERPDDPIPGAHTYNGKPYDDVEASGPVWMTNVMAAVGDENTTLHVTLDGMPNRNGEVGNWNTPEAIAEAFQVAVRRGEPFGVSHESDYAPPGNGTAWEMSVIARNVRIHNDDPDLGGRSWDSIRWYSNNQHIPNVPQPNIPELEPGYQPEPPPSHRRRRR